MESSLTRPERIAMARMHALLELLPRVLDQRVAPHGLTSFEYTVLEALYETDQHRLRLSALAARTNATLPRLSRVATALEKRGLIVRAACAEDGRATNAVLTDTGERRFLDARPGYEQGVRELVLGELSPADLDELARLSYAVLWRLDPEGRLTTLTSPAQCPADQPACPADPPRCAADPTE